MAEYIEREAAIAVINRLKSPARSPAQKNMITVALTGMNRIPSADVAPVVHSRFVDMGGFRACQHCGASPAGWEPKPNNQSGYPPYCYNCGAKMQEEATDWN